MGNKQHPLRATGDRKKHCVYRYFDEAGALLYVGVTNDPVTRENMHRKCARSWRWFQHAARRTLEWHESRSEAEASESRAISEERPAWNKVGKQK